MKKNISQVEPKDVGDFPTGELNILVGGIKSGKTPFALKAALTYLMTHPGEKVGVMSDEYSLRELGDCLLRLIKGDSSLKHMAEERFKDIVFIPGPYRCAPRDDHGNRSKRDREYLKQCNAILYDLPHSSTLIEDDLVNILEENKDSLHVWLQQGKQGEKE